MSSSIREFWDRLENSIHPEDASIFASIPHTFNLDFPPPAFIGDVDKAPVVILKLHGGYDPIGTTREFPTDRDSDEYRDWLKGVRVDPPQSLSAYYKDDPLYDLVEGRQLVIVNAVAYRVVDVNANRSLAERLPSVRVHREWFQNELVPDAVRGTRLVILQQWSLWKTRKNQFAGLQNVQFEPNPRTKYVSKATQQRIRDWLRSERGVGPKAF